MTAGPVVSNTSPLIALEQIGRLDLLAQLFGQVLVPPGVVREIAPQLLLPAWIAEQPLAQPVASPILQTSLGAGESESFSLALELGAAWVILDDRPARRLAQSMGLTVIGTLGLLLAGKKRGLLTEIKSSLDSLLRHGFYIAPPLYKKILTDAGETP